MMNRYGVWLDGLPLHEIDPSIILTDIIEQPAVVDVISYPRAQGSGLRIAKRTRQSLSVSVRFAIWEYDVTRRKAVMQKIVTWAKSGKYLAINDRPGQRLRVEVDSMPTIQSALKWTQDLTITFTAYAMPFWESDDVHMLTTSDVASMMIMGDGDQTLVDATIQVEEEGDVTVKADNTTITLTDVSGTINITHGDDGILRITAGEDSLLSHREPKSSDDLIATPGRVNEFSVIGGTATFRVRGVWA